MSTNRYSRLGVIGGVAGILALLAAPAASAHVRASAPEGAQQGEYAVVGLRVPNEEDAAKTNKIVVTLPTDHPVGSVSTEPVPGWTASITKTKLNPPKKEGKVTITEAPTTVTFTAAQGAGIVPDQFQVFNLSIGPLPTDTNTLLLPTAQTYDNGKVVDWVTPAQQGQQEPEHPAPQVKLAPAGAAEVAPAALTSDSSSSPGAVAGADQTARWLGGVGLVVGALGLAFGAVAIVRARKIGSTS